MVNQVIKNLSELIDLEIHRQMQEFSKLGRLAKKISLEGISESEIRKISSFSDLGREATKMASQEDASKEIEKIHTAMFNIFKGLKICEPRVRELYPSLSDLFNLFTKVKKQ